MASERVQLAQALADDIQAAQLDPDAVVERLYVPEWIVQDLGGVPRIAVAPDRWEGRWVARDTWQQHITVALVVQHPLADEQPATIDAHVDLADALRVWLLDHPRPAALPLARLMSLELIGPDPEVIRRSRVAMTMLRATYWI